MAETTSAGRKLYKEGNDYYSEKTVTVETDYGWVNVPSVDANGDIIPEDKLVDIVNALGPVDPLTGRELDVFEDATSAVKAAKSRTEKLSDEIKEYAKGGDVEKDPISGNKVPVGATPKEVRDDVPAMLSEGEFVLPADVVRYIGLNNIMKLRDAAKEGLAHMDAQGQMGNSEEATTDETKPVVNMDSMVDDVIADAGTGMATGGVIGQYMKTKAAPVRKMATGGTVMPKLTVAGAPIQSQQKTAVLAPKLTPSGGYKVPDISTYLPAQQEGVAEDVTYVGPNGETVVIREIGGNPVTPVPEGFTKKQKEDTEDTSLEKTEEEKTEDTTESITCPPGQTFNGVACVPINRGGNSESEQDAKAEVETDTTMALVAAMARDNPEMAARLAAYKDNKMGTGDIIAAVFGGPTAWVKAIGQGVKNNKRKAKLIESAEAAKTGITSSLLRDWAGSTRSEEEVMDAVEKAMNKGASLNTAVAIAIDDNFDSSVLDREGLDLSEWEQSTSDRYGTEKNSDQSSRLLKEDLDLFDGDLEARDAFINGGGSTSNTRSNSNSDSTYTAGNFTDTQVSDKEFEAAESSFDWN